MRAGLKFLSVTSLAVASLPGLAGGQAIFEAERESRPKVEVAPVERVKVPAGKATSVDIRFRVRHPFHINSNAPSSELLIPTVLKLNPPTNVSVGNTAYPPGKDMSFPFAPEEKLSVYAGDFMVSTHVSAARNTPPGTYRVRGELQYQACDDRACYPPAKLPVIFDVTVGKASSNARRRNPPQSPHIK